MINLIFNNGILTFENADYTISAYQNLGFDEMHLFIQNEQNSMVIFLDTKTTTVNETSFVTMEEMLIALGNPVEIQFETL
jgi:hypothetical protein